MNYIDLTALPKGIRGIDWQNICNISIPFTYHNINDTLTIVKHINQDYVLIRYREREYTISKDCLKKCKLGIIFNYGIQNNYKYDVGDIILRKSGCLKILSKTRSESKTKALGIRYIKAYNVICTVCDYNFIIREGNIDKGNGCPVCSNRIVKIGYNDLWTTNYNESLYLTNKNDGYLYTKNSNFMVDLTCPYCNTHIGKRKIYDLTHNKVSCRKCSDGISYPNKFISNLLEQLNEIFITEVVFDWCVFPSFENKNKLCHGKYDCVIPNKKIIIEMDSGLGHGNVVYSHSNISPKESIYKDNMKTKLAIENGYKIIRINCPYYGSQDPFNACYKGIMESDLYTIYDLSNINWRLINVNSYKSHLIHACKLYDDNYSLNEIANILHISEYTAKEYLKKGAQLNLCTYKLNTRRKKNEF